MPVLLPKRWTHDVPTEDGFYWGWRLLKRLWMVRHDGPTIIEVRRGSYYLLGELGLEGDDCMPEFFEREIRDMFQAFTPVESPPPCDVPLKC